MAAGNSPKITLSENDINGASLRGKTPGQLTIPELKRWLSCRRGARLRGTKRALVERVQSYIDGGLDKGHHRSGQWRKRRKLGIDGGNATADAITSTVCLRMKSAAFARPLLEASSVFSLLQSKTLPEVRKKPPVVDYANGALLAWKQLIERMLMKDLTLNWLYLYSLDAVTVRVRFENGAVEIERFSDVGEVTSSAECRKRLSRRLTNVVHRWAGLPPTARAFDEHTCRDFSLRGIDEIGLHLIISQHYRRPQRSTQPGAPPFAVEYEVTKIATWACAGHYFDFEEANYDMVDEQNPYTARLSHWLYDFYRTQTGAPKCRDTVNNAEKK